MSATCRCSVTGFTKWIDKKRKKRIIKHYEFEEIAMSQLLTMATNAYPNPLQNLATVRVYSIIKNCAADYKDGI